MNKPVFNITLLYAGLAGAFILLDLALDYIIGEKVGYALFHLILAISVVIVSFILLNSAMAARRRAETALRQAHDDLEIRVRERTKELNCLYGISSLAGKPDSTLNEILQEIVALLPPAWQYPDAACARIVLDDQEFKTKNYRETLWKQSSPLLVHGKPAGAVEVGYLEEKTAQDEGPFCIDERNLIDAIAERVSRITERKRVEEALRTSEEKFSTIFQSSPDAIALIKQADNTFLDINEAFTKLFGHERSEVIGKKWEELGFAFTGDGRDKLFALYREEEKVADYEIAFKTGNDDITTVLISLRAITIGGESCLLAIAHDITGRKRSEEALRQAQSELALGIQQRITLEERQRLARELHDSVSQALYGISLGTHTALTLFDTDQQKVREALNYVLSQAQAGLTEMRALIFELRPESLEMEGLVSALTKQTAALHARYGLDVEVSLCDEPDVSLSIKEVLYRIAQEALQNAVKHAQANRLEVCLACEPEFLRLEVRDNGVGFDPTAAYPGHLGLRSMRERAERAGGKLDIESTPGRGTQIRARFPLSSVQAIHPSK